MKKVLFSFIIIFAATHFAKAQTIPNGDFENWTSGVPDGWSILLPTASVVQSTDKQKGVYSVKFAMNQSFERSVLATNGYMLATHTFSYFLNGYIKANLIKGESFIANVFYVRNSDQSHTGGSESTGLSRTSWTPFHVSLYKPVGFTPDSFEVFFVFDGSSSLSYVMIDNLNLSNTAIGDELGTSSYFGIESVLKQTIHSSFYPNPTKGNAEIEFSLISSTNINIKIYDVTGRLINTVLNEMRNSGNQNVKINLENIQNGIYFYTITGNGFSETKKFVVNR